MASFTITSFVTAPQTLNNNEFGVVADPAGVLVASGNAITTTGVARLVINSTVISTNGEAGPGAHAVYAAAGTALDMRVGPEGYVTAANPDVVFALLSSDFKLNNAGTIQGRVVAIPIDINGSLAIDLVNTGVMDAISVQGGDERVTITNSGIITGGNNDFGGDAIQSNFNMAGETLLRNSGEITGASTSFRSGAYTSRDMIFNAGVMNGDIDFGAGADRYEGAAGRVQGVIDGGQGGDSLSGGAFVDVLSGGEDDDLLVGRGGDDSLDGGLGADHLIGGDGNDVILGDGDAVNTGTDSVLGSGPDDTLVGNAGDDKMDGGAGADVIVGQDGADVMQGGSGNDTMDGGQGNDVLEGGEGNDVLRGRAGEDELSGGLGLDFYTGGADADIFVFRTAAHAGIGATRDQILDFEQGIDQINVAGMSPGVFEFRGTAAFAPSGNPEIRLFETPTGSTIVQFDVNGDGATDAEIRVANVTGLTELDFAL